MVKTVRKSSRVKRSRKHNRRHTRRNRGGAIARQQAVRVPTKANYFEKLETQKENEYKTLFIMLYGLPEEELAEIRTSADVKHKFEEIRSRMKTDPDFAYTVYSWAYMLMADRPRDATEIFDVRHGRRPSHVAFDILPGPLSEQEIAGLPNDPQFEKAHRRYRTVMAELQ